MVALSGGRGRRNRPAPYGVLTRIAPFGKSGRSDKGLPMVYVELEPNLSTCIETLARRAYEQTLSRILEEQSEEEDLLEKMEVLRLFLESTDFWQRSKPI